MYDHALWQPCSDRGRGRAQQRCHLPGMHHSLWQPVAQVSGTGLTQFTSKKTDPCWLSKKVWMHGTSLPCGGQRWAACRRRHHPSRRGSKPGSESGHGLHVITAASSDHPCTRCMLLRTAMQPPSKPSQLRRSKKFQMLNAMVEHQLHSTKPPLHCEQELLAWAPNTAYCLHTTLSITCPCNAYP